MLFVGRGRHKQLKAHSMLGDFQSLSDRSRIIKGRREGVAIKKSKRDLSILDGL